MKACILRCRPGSQFHFGSMALDSNTALHDTTEFFHSDTLFSALINIVGSLGGQAQAEAVVALFQSGQITVSDGMFCLRLDGEDLFFLPRPVHFSLLMPSHNRKKWERIQFISQKLWESGLVPSEAGKDAWEREVKVFGGGKFAALYSEFLDNFFEDFPAEVPRIHTLPKVQARKKDQEDAFYALSNVVMPDNGPESFRIDYYFLLQSNVEDSASPALASLMTAIHLLPETGLGGERSGGCGLFEGVDIVDFGLRPFRSNGVVTVGLAVPKDHTDLDLFQYYRTVFRGGRSSGTEQGQLKKVRMIETGAWAENTPQGSLQDIRTDTDKGPFFLRYGKPLCLPAHADTLPPNR